MKVCVSFHWTLFALCSLCVCVHVFVCSQRPSSAVWSGVQMAGLGPAEGECLSALVSFPLPFSCSLSSFLCLVSFTSYTPDYLLSFIIASAESHLGLRRVFLSLFSVSVLLYVPLRASCGSYTRWLWNEMSLNQAMCPGATVIAGEIQLPL